METMSDANVMETQETRWILNQVNRDQVYENDVMLLFMLLILCVVKNDIQKKFIKIYF